MSTVAQLRNPSRLAATLDAVAGLAALFARPARRRSKIGVDSRTLQTVPDYVLADMGLERMEIRTSFGSQDIWIGPRR